MFRSFIPFQRHLDRHPFATLQRDVNRLFESSFGDMALPSNERLTLAPSIDVKETDKAIEVAAELPGVDQKDVNVTYADGVLTIKGEKRAERDETKGGYHLAERSYGSFMRSLAIDDVATDRIEANFTNGVLRVVLPKAAPTQSKTKTIAIKSAG